MNCPAEDAPARLLRVTAQLVQETHPRRQAPVTLDCTLERDLGLDSLARVELLLRLGREFGTYETHQPFYSLIKRDIERDLIPAMQSYGLGLLPYYPLAAGLLTGKYTRNSPSPAGARLTGNPRLAERYLTDANWAVMERLEQFCAGRNRSLLELAFSWLLAQPAVSSVIAGATRPEQLELNVRASDWELTAEELAEIDQLSSTSHTREDSHVR